MKKNKTLTLTVFTDPMMGLSYESEPYFRRLETSYAGQIDFRYVMSGLVRNVYDFVDSQDLKRGQEYAVEQYNQRLAKIYESEEAITGMPINMENLQLFSKKYTSSLPLNLAYKAAQLADSDKANLFLYNLRYATIVECKPTTRLEEILSVVRKTKISQTDFLMHYEDGSAQAALDDDFRLRQSLDIRGLPACLFEYDDVQLMVSGVIDYDAFKYLIDKVTHHELIEKPPAVTIKNVRHLIDKHPLISPVEIKEAFGLHNLTNVRELIEPLLASEEIYLIDVHHGWFIQKK